MTLEKILTELMTGNLDICYTYRELINQKALEALKEDNKDTDLLSNLILIGNITYNNTDRTLLPIEDGIYDLLVNKLQKLDYNKFECGAKPIIFENSSVTIVDRKAPQELISPITIMSQEERDKFDSSMYNDVLVGYQRELRREDFLCSPITIFASNGSVSKRQRNVAHNHPDLVGTLEKCHFVINADAISANSYDLSNIKIFERDFFGELIQKGFITSTDIYEMIATIKYDGISVEADVNTEVESARTRGDTGMDEASDLTPILGGYQFPRAKKLDKSIGMKFEAIIRYPELQRLNEERGTSYINGRTAIIGLLGSSDAYLYRDYITLVPIQADFGEDVEKPSRAVEIEFLNRYYSTREDLRYTVFRGTTTTLLYNIREFVKEAQDARDWIPFMYDGVVLEFADSTLRNTLGRKRSINQYAMALKFEPLTKETIFRGFTYTVGQNGNITPMIHYDPIEFMGAIHTKSTGSSLARFNKLDLNIGDTIGVKYVNDVMPYVFKLTNKHNADNHMRPKTKAELFPTHCPACGTPLKKSKNGATAKCPNMECPERVVQRMATMVARLGIKDFSVASIEVLGVSNLYELMTMTIDQMEDLGPNNSQKFYTSLQDLCTHPWPDYRVIGAVGFSDLAIETWKKIFNWISLEDLFGMYLDNRTEELRNVIMSIDGCGKAAADTIIEELPYFEPDIRYIIDHHMYIPTKRNTVPAKYHIRFTGFRDRELAEILDAFDYIDCNCDGSVTSKTTHLLVPYEGYSEGNKCKLADKYNIPKISILDFMENPNKYIPELTKIVRV